jgi:hypothetical protein
MTAVGKAAELSENRGEDTRRQKKARERNKKQIKHNI